MKILRRFKIQLCIFIAVGCAVYIVNVQPPRIEVPEEALHRAAIAAASSKNETLSERQSTCKPPIIQKNNEASPLEIGDPLTNIQVYGEVRKRKPKKNEWLSLTIGVPFTSSNETLLEDTLNSIINTTDETNKKECIIVVYLSTAYANCTYNTRLAKKIVEKYKQYIESGFIVVVQKLQDHISTASKLTTVDMKQVYDVATLLKFSSSLPTNYYLQLEDGVKCKSGFASKIKQFLVLNRDNGWIVMDFTRTTVIGKLVETKQLEKLSLLMLTFYKQQTVEQLFYIFRNSMAQTRKFFHNPALFHLQRCSAFVKYSEHGKTFSGPGIMNPPAFVVSTVMPFNQQIFYSGLSAHSQQVSLIKGDKISIIFTNKRKISHVFLKTGNTAKTVKGILSGSVILGTDIQTFDVANNDFECTGLVTLGDFDKKGVLDADIDSNHKDLEFKCVIIMATKIQKGFTILDRIQIK